MLIALGNTCRPHCFSLVVGSEVVRAAAPTFQVALGGMSVYSVVGHVFLRTSVEEDGPRRLYSCTP